MAPSSEDLVTAMIGAGCRMTPQRRAILDYLAGRADHPSAGQIHRGLSATVPSLSVATVYNTLATLVDLGLLREIEFAGVDNRYDTNLGPHINLVCLRCGSIEDFEHEARVPSLRIQAELGFETKETRVEARGICARCLGNTGE